MLSLVLASDPACFPEPVHLTSRHAVPPVHAVDRHDTLQGHPGAFRDHLERDGSTVLAGTQDTQEGWEAVGLFQEGGGHAIK